MPLVAESTATIPIRSDSSEPYIELTAGLLGFDKTYFRVSANFFHASSCHQCQTRKRTSTVPPGTLRSIPPSYLLFQRVGIDFSGPFPNSTANNRCIIAAIDSMTRYAETRAVANTTTPALREFFLRQVLLRHGAPQRILGDRGTPFLSNLLRQLLRLGTTI